MKQSQSSHSIWAETEPYCILRRLWKNLWMILMSAALFSLVAYIGTSLFLTQRYTCSATFVVSPRNSTTAYQSSSAITNTTTAQFASLLSGSPLVSRVKRLCGSDVQGATVSTSVVKDTNLIQLKTYGPSPRSAYYMCVGILDHYEEYSQIVFRSVILEPVSAPNVPDKSALKRTQRRTVLLAAPIGALVMTALLVLLTILSGTVQTVAGAKNQVDGSLLVTLNHQRKRKTLRSLLRKRKTSLLISNPTTSFLYVETIHQLRTHVEHAKHKHGCKTFLVMLRDVAELQPNVVQVDGLDQNGEGSGAVGAQHVGEDLVPRQSGLGGFGPVAGQALADAPASGLFGAGDAADVVGLAEVGGLRLFAVGDHAQLNVPPLHPVEPGQQLRLRHPGGVGQHGVVEVQHQKPNAPAVQELRGQVRELVKDGLRQKGKHGTRTPFISCQEAFFISIVL